MKQKIIKLQFESLIDVTTFRTDLLEYWTNGNTYLVDNQIREGCVIRPYEESNDKKIGRKILKSISPKYLLRKGGTEFK